jgi:hypothetical protein
MIRTQRLDRTLAYIKRAAIEEEALLPPLAAGRLLLPAGKNEVLTSR